MPLTSSALRDVHVQHEMARRRHDPLEHDRRDRLCRVPTGIRRGADRERHTRPPERRPSQHRADGARMKDGVTGVRAVVHAREDDVGRFAERAMHGGPHDERGSGLDAEHGTRAPLLARLEQQPAVLLHARQRRTRAARVPRRRGDGHVEADCLRCERQRTDARALDTIVIGHERPHLTDLLSRPPRRGSRPAPRAARSLRELPCPTRGASRSARQLPHPAGARARTAGRPRGRKQGPQ